MVDAERLYERLQPLDLIVEAVCYAPLQNRGDVFIELTVLLSQGRYCHHDSRSNLVQMHDNFPQLTSDGPRLGVRLA
jgi:hypothetical protein